LFQNHGYASDMAASDQIRPWMMPPPPKGRGAVSNPDGRFEPAAREIADDGWGILDEEPEPLRTTVLRDTSRSVIAHNNSPDVGFDQSINPYRGCEHGCIYCYARPSHAFLGFSPGLDFETKIFAKFDAPVLLEKELRRKGYRCDIIALGANTDAYQPVERELKITRGVLEVLQRFRQPVSVITKSALVVRDIDILAEMSANRLAQVTVSVTSLDRETARRLEPRAATPPRRLKTIRALADAGIPVRVNVAPVIPGLTDHELEAILEAARDAGAQGANYILVRLPLEIKDLFRDWLQEHAPDRARRVLNLIRETRGGALNRSEFGERMKGTGPYADLIRARFRTASRRLGLDRKAMDLDTSRFRVPPGAGDQLGLPI